MPKKKSTPRKKTTRKTSSRRELPRIPAPELWTGEEALRRYVYVLLPQYVSQDTAEGVLFYACVDDEVIEVRPEMLQSFFTDYADRTFITCDAPAFHRVCIGTFKDSRKDQAAVWRLSRNHRLWDVALLDRRVRYAADGYPLKIADFNELCRRYAPNVTAPWDTLRSIFVNLVAYAVSELPLFRTYWDLGTTDETGDSCHGVDLPRPLTTDEYCELLYVKRYESHYAPSDMDVPTMVLREAIPDMEEQEIQSQYKHPTFELEAEKLPEPQSIDYLSIDTASAFRRRDLILCGSTGPLGIGLDLQAAIVSARMKSTNFGHDVKWNESIVSGLDNLYGEISLRLFSSRLFTGFEWKDRLIARNSKSFVLYSKHKLQARLSEIWQACPSFITGRFTAPFCAKNQISTMYADWTDYRHLDPSIEDWIRLETIATLLRLVKQQQFPSGIDFPRLRFPVAEGLSTLPMDISFFETSPSHTLLTVQIGNLPLVAFLCTMLSEYLLYKPISSDARPSPNKSYFVSIIEGMLEELRDTSRKPHEVPGPEYVGLAKKWKALPELNQVQAIVAVVEVYMRHEDAVALKRRLGALGFDLSPAQIDLFYWLTLKHLFTPFLPTWYEAPFFRAPDSGSTKKSRQESRPWHDSFLRSFSPDDLMVQIASNHFGTKSSYPSSHVGFIDKVRDHGWSIVNNLLTENYATFLPKDKPGDEFDDLLAAMRRTKKEYLLEELIRTNAISCSGRIGRPIQYYEVLWEDTRQVIDDLLATIAYSLIEQGRELLFVSGAGFMLHVPSETLATSKSTITSTVIQAAIRFLEKAFPHGSMPECLGTLFSGLVKCNEID